ncbi:MAG: Asp-tRNA(Asn)/Glu-tRNA(Gln) amidotransferase subunit GatA [Phycisphaerae bacterium]|nr:Asp-tRNA(Asn)/Glu-tRNA(Gln) amidotransferase subunit GatA [Phycisphaerae bacterium]NIP51451.1 Asp-tRNA(Asn)/Glu-tRNA(Gln) amidotransferase subunit GatA [Phycisphaerae bacterium]NIS50655.1 Asp-tRNA(Asn)/Glu-tRNA(Gln) amidotransferase subunit GatA [Phycisphaerae bacterium]NIU08388.1 Asp-tRNA(Asn)/Glu-tRNA(Gln) amidotransferase subunit GatA [Phycisphaerae bacterium]NIU55887.1 Asp-tRNA(Asn)/Glu-tRNA(Gln) amidotransferase subunit GatA [Phycisphaerae bacterium]
MENLSAIQLRDKIAAGEVSSVEANEAIFKNIEEREPVVGAYISTYRDNALEKAAEIDKRLTAGEPTGELAGVPVAVKDNMCTTFGATTCASKILENFHAPYNATAVEKLISADAVIVGKTNMDEFAMGSSTENSGLKKTVNPWDNTRVTGGSSGGSAAAVAGGLCFAALGSDTGGSIRQPASFCGVVGLKPTYGRVSRFGLVAYGSSLDQIGPITSTVTDSALMLNVIAGHDSRDSTSVDETIAPVCDYLEKLDEPLEKLKIAVVPEFNVGAEEQVQKALTDAIDIYKTLGAEVIEINMPHLDYAIAAYYVIATAEASSNLARYDGVHYGHRSEKADDYIEIYSKSRAEAFGQEVKRRIMLGTYALSSGYYDAYYLKALKVRNLIRADFTKAFEKCEAILMPVSPTAAFKIGEKVDDPLKMYLSDIYTIAANLAGIPGISIPCGFDDNDLPIGLQILSPAFTEDKLLRIARMFEKETDYHRKRPDF